MTLIELMVGLVIGLIATLIVTQVLAIAESQKRSATSGSDAQVNGALALYALQRELQVAGYGLATKRDVLGCDTRARYSGAARNRTLVPVTITAGASGTPDTLSIMSSAKNSAALPTRVTQLHTKTDTEFMVESTVGLSVGDVLIAVPDSIDASNWCTMVNVTGIATDASGHHVSHAAGTNGPWNLAPTASIFPTTGYAVNSYLINAGRIIQRQYTVNTGTRMLQEAVSDTQTGAVMSSQADLYPEIVDLQAMYGKDTNKDGVVDKYDKVTPANASAWAEVLTVRVAVLARSSQYEKDLVTLSQPLWDVGSEETNIDVPDALTCGASRCITMNVGTDPNDEAWKHYRYKAYEAVVPLRNVLWSQ